MVKVALEYLRKKVEGAAGENAVTKCIFCCLQCCVSCVDYCVKQISKNAYIQMALTSNNFCVSAWSSFWLIVRNCARFSMTAGVGMILMFLGKLMIMVLSGWIAYLIIMAGSFREKVYSPVFPLIIVVAIAYLIGSIFLSLFSFSSTAILHCFILDSELASKGKVNVHTPESLVPFIELNDEMIKKKQQASADTVIPSDVKLEKKSNDMK